MKSKKPPVPTDYISANCWEGLYLGDDDAQKKAAQRVMEGLGQKRSGIYIILGPPRTGKGAVFQEVAQRAEKQFNDAHIVEDEYRDSLKAISVSESKHNIIRLEEDMWIEKLPESLANARELIKQHPNSSIIIDGHIHEPRISGQIARNWAVELETDKRRLSELLAQNQDIVVVRTKHNIEQIKKALWNLNQNLVRNYSQTGEAIRDEILTGNQGVDIDKITTALNENDEQKYNLAFQRIIEQQVDLPD